MKKIFVLFLVLTLTAGLTGCGGESPEQAVKNALDAVKNMNKETASKYLDYNELISEGSASEDATEEDADSEAMMKLILNNLDYKIVSSTIDGDSAIVETEITNIDMSNVMADFIPEVFGLAFSGLSEDELNVKYMDIFTNLMNRKDNKTVTNTVKIQLSKADGSWNIDMSDELADAILGGIISATQDMGLEDDDSDEELSVDDIE